MKRVILLAGLVVCSAMKSEGNTPESGVKRPQIQQGDKRGDKLDTKYTLLFTYCPPEFRKRLQGAIRYLESVKKEPTAPGKIGESLNHVLDKLNVYVSSKEEDKQKLIALIPEDADVAKFLEATKSPDFKALMPLYEAINALIVFACARLYCSEFDIANSWFWSVNWGRRPRLEIDTLDDYFSKLVFPDTFGEGSVSEREFLAHCYRLFLMPASREETLLMTEKLFDLIVNDREFRNTIACFKVRPSLMPTSDDIKESFEGWNGEPIKLDSKAYLPVINLYLKKGKGAAEKAVEILRKEFKDMKGCGIAPRFSLKINNWLYYAQGFGTPKKNPRSYAFLDKNANYALFNSSFMPSKTVEDYYLEVCE
ncbi:TPA: hypothetical protein DDZ86_04750 [Candidatus Dependentiae bacterium]|nr:MAG: hypothetical protein A2Y17_09555 [Clostridiales bacterium GWF2_38_85]HBL98921.1 hypothetical protein [Candidatus Dependentiae bacterium]